jgi:3-oxoacyl-[acyl-carrier protein] reductase
VNALPSFDALRAARSLQGRRALVTGAAGGMGRATARVLAAEGASVAVVDLNGAGAEAAAQEMRDSGGQARAWALDVSDAAAVARVVDEIAATLGGLDILVNNAGISTYRPIAEADYPQAWQRALAVMLTGPQQMVRAALPHLRKSDAARIVNIASTEALGATAGHSAYSAAKAGVTGLTRSLAVELGRERITVNCICPGPIRTPMTAAIPETDKTVFAKRRTALARYGEPEEVAQITVSLCLPAASYLTGAVIPVDGGLMARNA